MDLEQLILGPYDLTRHHVETDDPTSGRGADRHGGKQIRPVGVVGQVNLFQVGDLLLRESKEGEPTLQTGNLVQEGFPPVFKLPDVPFGADARLAKPLDASQ